MMNSLFSILIIVTVSCWNQALPVYDTELLDCPPCQCHSSDPLRSIEVYCKNATLSVKQFNDLWPSDLNITFLKVTNFEFDLLPVAKRQITIEIMVEDSEANDLNLYAYDHLRTLKMRNITLLGNKSLLEIPPTLQILNVTNSTLSSIFFTNQAAIQILDLTSNNFEQIIALTNLTQLILRNNSIKTFSTEYCTPMLHLLLLDLSRNFIEAVPEDAFECFFPTKMKLQNLTLDLSKNIIQTIHENAFKNVKLFKIDLSHNKIQRISSNQFNWRGLSFLNLQFNPWRCDCSAQWMLDELIPLLYSSQQSVVYNFRCASPKLLKNKPLVYWLNHSEDAFCGNPSSLSLTDPEAKSEMLNMVTIIVSAILLVINIILLIVLIIIYFNCIRIKGNNQKRKPINGNNRYDKISAEEKGGFNI